MTSVTGILKLMAAGALAALAFAPPALAAERCTASASAPWKAGAEDFTVEGFADGPTCQTAVSVIVIRNKDGAISWYEASASEFVMLLTGKNGKAEMEAALKDWVAGGSSIVTAADLPEWKAGTDQPGGPDAEFPFYQEEGIDQAAYEELRKAKVPVFCYVQGMESLGCIAIDPTGAGYKIGVQSFPG